MQSFQAYWHLISASLASAAAMPALAQVPSGTSAIEPAAAESTGEARLDEIVVTAQRREERLQDVPVSVSVVSPMALRTAGVADLVQIAKASPSVTINQGNGPLLTFIRGIGNTTSAAGNEASAAVYIDGVYVARPVSDMFSLTNIERVEVLKGPQGTLFGRNSSGGLINIVTRSPTAKPTAEVSLGYSNYQTIDTSVYLSGGIANGIAADFAAFYHKQRDGWGTNVTLNRDTGFGRRYGVRSKIVAEVSDNTKITLSVDYLRSRTNIPFGNPVRGTTQGNPAGLPPNHLRAPVLL
ncbi:TonB-dependent receptor [Novosphingobium colocasiae]